MFEHLKGQHPGTRGHIQLASISVDSALFSTGVAMCLLVFHAYYVTYRPTNT